MVNRSMTLTQAWAALLTLLTGRHHYLATGCLHGEHEYCQRRHGHAGTKKPAECKFCTARCVCRCHRR